MPDKTVMLVFAAPRPGISEEAFGEWYDGVHVPERYERMPALTAVTRYRRIGLPGAPAGSPPHPFVSVYELDATAEEALAAMRGGSTSLPPELDPDMPPTVMLFEAISSSTR